MLATQIRAFFEKIYGGHDTKSLEGKAFSQKIKIPVEILCLTLQCLSAMSGTSSWFCLAANPTVEAMVITQISGKLRLDSRLLAYIQPNFTCCKKSRIEPMNSDLPTPLPLPLKYIALLRYAYYWYKYNWKPMHSFVLIHFSMNILKTLAYNHFVSRLNQSLYYPWSESLTQCWICYLLIFRLPYMGSKNFGLKKKMVFVLTGDPDEVKAVEPQLPPFSKSLISNCLIFDSI